MPLAQPKYAITSFLASCLLCSCDDGALQGSFVGLTGFYVIWHFFMGGVASAAAAGSATPAAASMMMTTMPPSPPPPLPAAVLSSITASASSRQEHPDRAALLAAVRAHCAVPWGVVKDKLGQHMNVEKYCLWGRYAVELLGTHGLKLSYHQLHIGECKEEGGATHSVLEPTCLGSMYAFLLGAINNI